MGARPGTIAVPRIETMSTKTIAIALAGLLLAALLLGQTVTQTGDWMLVAGGLSPAYAYDGFSDDPREGMFLLNRRSGKVYVWITTYSDDLDDTEQDSLIEAFGVGFFMPVGVAHDSGRGAVALPLPNAQALRDLLGK